MTKRYLTERLDALQKSGLSPTLRAMAENIVRYRKWGNLGGFKNYRDDLLSRCTKRQPEHVKELREIIYNA